MTAPQATQEPLAPPATGSGRLHRPLRAVVALAELVAAGFAVWGAFWAWPHGFATITTVLADGTELDSQRVFGNWLAAAIGFGALAAMLVLDAVRQLLLAVRARPRRAKRKPDADAEPDAAPDAEPDAAPDAEPAAGTGETTAAESNATASETKVTGDD